MAIIPSPVKPRTEPPCSRTASSIRRAIACISVKAASSPARSEKDVGPEGVINTIRRREYAERFHEALVRGLLTPDPDLPRLERGRRIELPLAQQRRVAILKEWRKTAATRIGLELSLVIPQRLIDRIAEANPATLYELQAIDGLRRWRVEAFGEEILKLICKK